MEGKTNLKKSLLLATLVGVISFFLFKTTVTLIPTDLTETEEYLNNMTVLFSLGTGILASAISFFIFKKLLK